MANKSLLYPFPFTSKHKNRRFRKAKFIDQEIFHALGVINASFQFVTRVLVRNPDYHSFLTAVRVRRRARRRVRVRRRLSRWRVGVRRRLSRWCVGIRRRLSRWCVPRIAYLSDGLTNSASDGGRTRRQLQWGPAL